MRNLLYGLIVVGIFTLAKWSDIQMSVELVEMEEQARQASNDEELMPYVHAFIRDAREYDIDVSHILRQDMRVSFREGSYGRVLGIAYGMDNDNEVIIHVLKNDWDKMNEAKRLAVIYHELAHDVFNMEHECTPLMKAYVQPYSEGNPMIYNHIDEMFKLAKKRGF